MKKSRTEILTIGDEVLMGQIANTNAAFIAEKLTEAGMPVGWITTVGDDRQQILHAFRRAKARARAVIVTGGLGPTPDDLTKPCIAEFFKDKIEFREHLFEKVKHRFRDHGVEMPPRNRNQAEFPASANEISNPNGTATGIHYSRGSQEWFALPGVPFEMRYMIDNYVLPRLLEIGLGLQIGMRVLRTAGIGESTLLSKLTKFDEAQQFVNIAFLPRYFSVDVKLTARGENQEEIDEKLDAAEELLLPDLELYLYGRGKETLPEATGRLAKEKGIRIATAESCTGGLIAKMFTDTPGSSDYFELGVVSYSNESKTELLGIPAELIEAHGAVSRQVAEAMAKGMLDRSRADVTVSVTGIAGPTGGTDEKPVGLVYIGIADRKEVEVRKYRFIHDREINRNRTAVAAIKLLHDHIKNLDL
jgi:nicotinamide-nucleotide amidase